MTALIERLEAAVAETDRLQTVLGEHVDRALRLDGLDQTRASVKELGADVGRQLKSHARTISESRKLANELAQAPGEPPPAISPDAIVDQIRTMIDNVHEDVRKGREGETASTLRSVEVELKGLIVVDREKAQIVPPQPDRPIDPGQLSTIRMSFGAVPVARPSARPEPVPVPPSPAGPRATGRRRRPS
ncbi:MAG: hypothetical protein FJW96_14180 [Actinobacteria bacterium]|nr:hypothetical protein [Actinomycetota bacterium]